MPPKAPSGTKTKPTTTNNSSLDHASPAPAPISSRGTDTPNSQPTRPRAPLPPQHHQQQQTPHPPRRQRQPPEQKHPPSKSKPARIPLDDGWTLVATTHKMSRFRISDLAAAHTPNGPAPVMPDSSKEKLLERFAAYRERWRQSVCVCELRELLERADLDVQQGQGHGRGQEGERGEEQGEREMENGRGGARRTIENAVVLGLGSLSVDNIAGGVRSMWQLVCFLEMVALLSSTHREFATAEGKASAAAAGSSVTAPPPVPVYAEDPVFNALDEEVLADLGVEIVRPRKGGAGAMEEEGGAAQLIGDASFVFAPFMPSFVMMEEFLSGRDPLVYVGNDIAGMLELGRSQLKYSSSPDGDAHRTRQCIDIAEAFLSPNRGVATMPDFDLHPHALAGQMIYWRKPTAAAAAAAAAAASDG